MFVAIAGAAAPPRNWIAEEATVEAATEVGDAKGAGAYRTGIV
jgi:hypothetical protein